MKNKERAEKQLVKMKDYRKSVENTAGTFHITSYSLVDSNEETVVFVKSPQGVITGVSDADQSDRFDRIRQILLEEVDDHIEGLEEMVKRSPVL